MSKNVKPIEPTNLKFQIGQIVRYQQGDKYHYGRIGNHQARYLEQLKMSKIYYLIENGYTFATIEEEFIDTVYVNQDQSKNG